MTMLTGDRSRASTGSACVGAPIRAAATSAAGGRSPRTTFDVQADSPRRRRVRGRRGRRTGRHVARARRHLGRPSLSAASSTSSWPDTCASRPARPRSPARTGGPGRRTPTARRVERRTPSPWQQDPPQPRGHAGRLPQRPASRTPSRITIRTNSDVIVNDFVELPQGGARSNAVGNCATTGWPRPGGQDRAEVRVASVTSARLRASTTW